MPRNVRNFWLDANIDGRRARLVGGPVSKDGGFDLQVKVRDDGEVKDALSIVGVVRNNAIYLYVHTCADVENNLAPLNEGLGEDSYSFKITTNR